jgi:hypothetical protein
MRYAGKNITHFLLWRYAFASILEMTGYIVLQKIYSGGI